MPNVLLINDGRCYDHFGCNFVMRILLHALQPVRTVRMFDKPKPEDFDGIDFIVINGEGSTHHNRQSWLYQDYGVPSALINCVWQGNDPINLSHFRYISVRESMSAAAMTDCGVEPEIVPDVMLATELEGVHSDYGTIVTDSVIGTPGFSPALANLPLLSGAERLVCGRFHAVCLALVTGKAFSAYASNTWKTQAMLADAGMSELYYVDQEAAISHCPDDVHTNAKEFLREARAKIDQSLSVLQRLAGLAAYRSHRYAS